MRRQLTEIEAKLTAIDARLNKEFPNYVALAKPTPLKAEEVQKLLEVDEALVFWLPSDEESYVFASRARSSSGNHCRLAKRR